MNEFEKLKKLKEKVESSGYQLIREWQLNKIVELSLSNIDPVEFKGMVKLIAKTDNIVEDFNRYVKQQRSN